MKHFIASIRQWLFPDRQPTEKDLLLDSLHMALRKYTRALEKFTAEMKDVSSADCGYAQMLLEDLQEARHEYHQLRIVYEKKYGNIEGYRLKLIQFDLWINNPMWIQEEKPKCLFNKPLPVDTKPSRSAKAPLTTGIA